MPILYSNWFIFIYPICRVEVIDAWWDVGSYWSWCCCGLAAWHPLMEADDCSSNMAPFGQFATLLICTNWLLLRRFPLYFMQAPAERNWGKAASSTSVTGVSCSISTDESTHRPALWYDPLVDWLNDWLIDCLTNWLTDQACTCALACIRLARGIATYTLSHTVIYMVYTEQQYACLRKHGMEDLGCSLLRCQSDCVSVLLLGQYP